MSQNTVPPKYERESAEPKARILPDEFKDALEYLSAWIAVIAKHCDSQPVEGFTEAGRKKCLALYKSFVQEVANLGGPLLGGLGDTGCTAFTSRAPEGKEDRVQ
jgi:hypothetical protein